VIITKILFPLISLAFILKPTTILQKLTENNGSGVYIIEQEVQFPAVPEPILLKETWIIVNENRMRLIVTGLKDYKNSIHLEYLYENGMKLQELSPGKVERKALDENFIERYFHIRNPDLYASILVHMNVLTPSLLQIKPYKKGTEPEAVDDPHVRLARIGGTIAFALGLPSSSGGASEDSGVNFFVDQDTFTLRKFHLNSQVEVTADQFTYYARGLNFPKERIVKWQGRQGAIQVPIHTLRVLARSEKNISLKIQPSHEWPQELGASRALIEEFYSRFR
jgi:hypothetical protein